MRRLINCPKLSRSQQTSPSDVWLFPGLTNLGFLLRVNLLLYSSYLPLGVPNWVVILPASDDYMAAARCAREVHELTTQRLHRRNRARRQAIRARQADGEGSNAVYPGWGNDLL
jgi:hypothetical protein